MRGLADETAVAAAGAGDGQAQLDGLAADGDGADGPLLGPVADDIGGLAVGAAVVLGILPQVQGDEAVGGGRPPALVLAKAERVIEYRRGHAVLSKKVRSPFKKRHGPHFATPSTHFSEEPEMSPPWRRPCSE